MEASHRRRFGVVHGIESVGGWIECCSSRRKVHSGDLGNAGAGVDRIWPWGVDIRIDAAKSGLIAFPQMPDWVASDGADRRSRQDLYPPWQVESLNHTYIGGCAGNLRGGASGRCKQGKNRKNENRTPRCPTLELKAEWNYPCCGCDNCQTPHHLGITFPPEGFIHCKKTLTDFVEGRRKGGGAPRPCRKLSLSEVTGGKLCRLPTSQRTDPEGETR